MRVVRTQVYLRKEQHEFLREEAHRQHISLAELLRRVVESYMASEERKGRPPGAEAREGVLKRAPDTAVTPGYARPRVEVFSSEEDMEKGVRPFAIEPVIVPVSVREGQRVGVVVQVAPIPPVGTTLTLLMAREGKGPTTTFAATNSLGMATFDLLAADVGTCQLTVTFADAEVTGVPTSMVSRRIEIEVTPGQSAD